MVTGVMIASIVFTLIILLLTLITIQKGYGYNHTIDPSPEEDYQQKESMVEQNDKDQY